LKFSPIVADSPAAAAAVVFSTLPQKPKSFAFWVSVFVCLFVWRSLLFLLFFFCNKFCLATTRRREEEDDEM
jgi:phosphotransferase system  glucose/maltose/N-acetylglucosamine-specific IIC component